MPSNSGASDTKRTPGIGSVGAYQVAGRPFITGSAGDSTLADGAEDEISFPKVTRTVTVINFSSNAIRVHFASKDTGATISGKHFIELDSDEDSISLNVKTDKLFISNASGVGPATYRVIAELTGIPTGSADYDATGLAGISE